MLWLVSYDIVYIIYIIASMIKCRHLHIHATVQQATSSLVWSEQEYRCKWDRLRCYESNRKGRHQEFSLLHVGSPYHFALLSPDKHSKRHRRTQVHVLDDMAAAGGWNWLHLDSAVEGMVRALGKHLHVVCWLLSTTDETTSSKPIKNKKNMHSRLYSEF